MVRVSSKRMDATCIVQQAAAMFNRYAVQKTGGIMFSLIVYVTQE